MTRHTLYLLTPWMEGGNGPYYCPDCGVVEGFLFYNPGIREKIEIVNLDFPRPRPDLVKVLGGENQSSPVLVLTQGSPLPRGGKQSLSTGRVFIDDPLAIIDFLGTTWPGVLPHP